MDIFPHIYLNISLLLLILRKTILSEIRGSYIPRSNTQSYKNSFFPSAPDLWNNLEHEIRNVTSLAMLKKKLNNVNKPPSHYSSGQRKHNIILCQLRNEVSDLNHHLFQSHLSESSRCACGNDTEDNYHYFFICPLYTRERLVLFHDLENYLPQPDLDLLLCGSGDLSSEENVHLVNTVLRYIADTKRFN